VASPGGSRPGRFLLAAAALIVALYAGMFASGHKTPQLGLDLRGGTQVTLTPKVAAGFTGKIKKSQLDQAVNIIRQRVNGFGVAEADVATEGNNIVISVPGKGRDEVLNAVGSTALLRIRQVLEEGAPAPAATAPTTTPAPAPSGTPKPSTSASTKATPKPSSSAKGRAVPDALAAATPTPAPTPTGSDAASPTPSTSATTTTGPAAGTNPGAPTLLTLQAAQQFFTTFNCDDNKKPNDVASAYLVACDRDKATKYLLAPASVNGTEIKSASAGLPQNSLGGNDWQVDLSFKSKGTSQFADLTRRIAKLQQAPNCTPPTGCNNAAIVLDGVVQSAPFINDPNGIVGGQATISGNFTQKTAGDLANVLKYGALPIQFQRQDVVSVSATLGSDQLHAGLLAGTIGLIAVVIYSFIYYRGLGLVTVASLAVAGLLTYATVVLLGQAISYTLTLAGIAGLIVAIGITADSFVVYFERLRDEVREGRTLRSAADRGWARAQKTILAADFVSLLAAVVLYLLSIGSVRGFAFTLGLSTIIDLVVVYLFTRPLIAILVRGRLFGSGRPWTGLSPDRLGVQATRVEPETRRRRVPRTGEV
jgi:preprotein translocase subunit SecD